MNKYKLTSLSAPLRGWYEIEIDRAKELFDDERFTGEIVHLYNESEQGAESLIDCHEKLEEAILENHENSTPLAIYRSDVVGHFKLFFIED